MLTIAIPNQKIKQHVTTGNFAMSTLHISVLLLLVRSSSMARCFVSLSKTRHPHSLVLVKPRKPSKNDLKIVDGDVKPKKKTKKKTILLK